MHQKELRAILKSILLKFACLVIFPVQSGAVTLLVGRQNTYHSIREAVKMAHKGDTIRVSAGNYFEKNLVIDKPVFLTGINYPVLDGEGKYEVISVKSDDVVIEGFRIQRSGYAAITDLAGIKIYPVKNVRIRNNILWDNFFGIYAQGAANCFIQDNRITAHGMQEQAIGNGIHCWKSENLLISGNTISGHRDGIYFEFVTNSRITGNHSIKNIRYGLHFMFSHNDAYIHNEFRENGAGVAVMFTHGVKMYYNSFSDNWGDAAYGILLKEISDSDIRGNRFNKNTIGIYMEGASRVNMEHNLFENNGWALKIQASCMDVKVSGNNFFGNSFDVCTNGSLVLNYFNGNYWDKYEGYDLNKDRIGDIPYHPISMFSLIIEKNPPAMILFRSIMVALLDRMEKMIPTLTPVRFMDESPLMKPLHL